MKQSQTPSLYTEDYYRGPARWYHERTLRTLIRLGGLQGYRGLVMDWGCGHSHLRRLLPKVRVIGYDILPELSDCLDYRAYAPDVIVCSNVLEHLEADQIDDLMRDFRAMNPHAVLLVALPTENRLSEIGMRLTGQTWAHDDHKCGYKEVNKIIERHYVVSGRHQYISFGMQQVTRYLRDLRVA